MVKHNHTSHGSNKLVKSIRVLFRIAKAHKSSVGTKTFKIESKVGKQ